MSQAETSEEPVHSAFFSIAPAARIYFFWPIGPENSLLSTPAGAGVGTLWKKSLQPSPPCKETKGSGTRSNQPWIKASDPVESPREKAGQDRHWSEKPLSPNLGEFLKSHPLWLIPTRLGATFLLFPLSSVCYVAWRVYLLVEWMCDCFWHKRENI